MEIVDRVVIVIRIMKEIILGIILLIQGAIDLKCKEIPVIVSAIGVAIGSGICVIEGRGIANILPAIFPGLLALLYARISNETMGYGDGMLLVVMGLYLPWENVLEVEMLAFSIAGIVALILLVIFRKKRNFQMPFVPFLAIAYIMELFINGGVCL